MSVPVFLSQTTTINKDLHLNVVKRRMVKRKLKHVPLWALGDPYCVQQFSKDQA